MDIERRLEALEARLRAAEDQLEILNLLNSYGPLVDSGMDREAAELWIEGGGYNFSLPDGTASRLEAPEPLAGMYRAEAHREMVDTGSAHLTAPPKVTINGDDAQAVGYSFVVRREGQGWFVWRAAINFWRLGRTPSGWRIVERFNRAVDGSRESHETMRKVATI